mgnify:CR=1 FL=1
MLQQQPPPKADSDENISILHKLELIHHNFKLIAVTAFYNAFEVETRNSHKKRIIKVLGFTKDFCKQWFLMPQHFSYRDYWIFKAAIQVQC